MTPAYSTQLINATLPGPLASFGSALFPCAAADVRKWERRGCEGTRFGDAEGRVCRGYGTIRWDDYDDDDDNDDDDEGDDDEGDDGESDGYDGDEKDGEGGRPTSTARRGRETKKKKRRDGFLRRSVPSNACGSSAGVGVLLYCSEHLGMQYPSLSGKELQRIREFWAALEMAGGDALEIAGDITDDTQAKGEKKKERAPHADTRQSLAAREASEWSRRIQAVQPGYWEGLVDRGIAVEEA
ncbi:hypothetical protein Micbo1qcDRAFT_200611 [Microdochium bolleyi]|uniref:Uncharacterized protein n=1 Tax=Microdochium bolleyi TaxID=196109 RepID=A0A136JDG1_9PEZI|nr:hypothetical protein Micbo1qcDRAFT_200611 [Microdochium bolleyi]